MLAEWISFLRVLFLMVGLLTLGYICQYADVLAKWFHWQQNHTVRNNFIRRNNSIRWNFFLLHYCNLKLVMYSLPPFYYKEKLFVNTSYYIFSAEVGGVWSDHLCQGWTVQSNRTGHWHWACHLSLGSWAVACHPVLWFISGCPPQSLMCLERGLGTWGL